MENSTDSMSDLDYKSLVNQCLEMCSALKDKGCKFSLSLRLGSSFNFSLSSEGCSPPEATQKPRRSPSYLRRQTLRRAAFLERKKKPPLAEETASTGNDNNVCRQEGSDLLDKKVASSGQTAQPPPPPPPLPPPPAVPTRRLVTVTKDRASRSSFCQLDGEATEVKETTRETLCCTNCFYTFQAILSNQGRARRSHESCTEISPGVIDMDTVTYNHYNC